MSGRCGSGRSCRYPVGLTTCMWPLSSIHKICVLTLPVPCRVWASGVGYGHDHGGGADDIWNASAAEAAQAAHDAELQKLLDDFTAGLRQQLGERLLVFVTVA